MPLCSVNYGGMQQVVREPEVAFGAAANSEVNSWETEWDYPTSHSLATKTQLEENVQSDITVKNSKEVTFAEPQVSEYDLSFFESFGVCDFYSFFQSHALENHFVQIFVSKNGLFQAWLQTPIETPCDHTGLYCYFINGIEHGNGTITIVINSSQF